MYNNNLNSLNDDLKSRKLLLELAESFAGSITELQQNIKSMQPDLSPLSNLANSIERERISREAQKVDLQPYINSLSSQVNQYSAITTLMKHSIDTLDASVTKLKVLLTDEEKKKLQEDILLSFYETSLSGDTVVDFREGIVTKSDGSESNLSSDIQQYMAEYVRSITIMTSVATAVTLHGRKSSLIYLPANKYIKITNHELHRITIESSSAFDLWLSASMEIDGAPEVT